MSGWVVEQLTKFNRTNVKRGLSKTLFVSDPSKVYKKTRRRRGQKRKRRAKKTISTYPFDPDVVVNPPMSHIVVHNDRLNLAGKRATFTELYFCGVLRPASESDYAIGSYLQQSRVEEIIQKRPQTAIVETIVGPTTGPEQMETDIPEPALRERISKRKRLATLSEEGTEEQEEQEDVSPTSSAEDRIRFLEMELSKLRKSFLAISKPMGLPSGALERFLRESDGVSTYAILWERAIGRRASPFAGIDDKRILLKSAVTYDRSRNVYATPNDSGEIKLAGSTGLRRLLKPANVVLFGIVQQRGHNDVRFVTLSGSFSGQIRLTVSRT